jgi:hypothetical protein
MSSWPNLAEVRKMLRLAPDPTEDSVIQTALAAAVDFGMRRLSGPITWDVDADGNRTGTWTITYTYPPDTTTLPDAAHEASLIHAARLYRRRDSVDGTIAWGDLGAVRVGRVDPDVVSLYDSIGPWGFA